MITGVIDAGNTAVKYGLFDQDMLVEEGTWQHGAFPAAAAWMISSVRAALPQEVLELPNALELNASTPLPFTNRYATPHTLGKDRLAAVAGAQHLFPGKHCLTIDAGTCITYDFIDAAGNYEGGSISPGLHMRLKAMHHFTGKLPEIDFIPFDGLTGKTTEESMLSGVLQGIAGEMDHFISAYHTAHGPLHVILCGGDGGYFEKRLKNNIFANPNLVLIGLQAILTYNLRLHAH